MGLSHLRIFGCLAYATIPPTLRKGKLSATAISGAMMGYDPHRKSYRIFDPITGKNFTSNQVRLMNPFFHWLI